jgi:hypothetical protein
LKKFIVKPSKPTNSSPARKPSPRKRQTAEELRVLQRLMARAVMRPLTPGQRMRRRWSDGRPTQSVAAQFIKPNDRLTSFERLEIYNRQYWFRLRECFYEDYPGLRALLGEQRFADLTVAYLARHPSTRFTLRNLGQYLVGFIEAEPRWTMPHQQLALDMARLEWAHIEAFDNAAWPPLSARDLPGRNPAQIHLRLQPFITLLELAYPLDDYLIALRDNHGLRGEASNAMENSDGHTALRARRLPARRTVRLVVHRHQNTVYYKRLQKPQFDLLKALQNGASLETALQSALPATRKPPPVQDWFNDWSALGWFWI